MTNKFGLSRNIPESIKRKVRQACGYGCVECGNAIYEYEHVDPEFNNAKEHLVKGIALLCSSCHSMITRKLWSKERIKAKRLKPKCFETGFSNFSMEVGSEKPFVVNICGNSFVNTSNLIEIDDRCILSILEPEDSDFPIPRISASFYNSDNEEIAWISNNEWFGLSDSFDIQTQANKITIRKKMGDLSLVIKTNPPYNISIEKIDLSYNNIKIIGSETEAFKVTTKNSNLIIPNGSGTPNSVPFWISVKGDAIYVGTSKIADFEYLNGNKIDLAGYYELVNTNLTISRDNSSDSQNSLKIESLGEQSRVGMNFKLPDSEHKLQRIELFWERTPTRKSKCTCGSEKEFRYCCGKNRIRLEYLLNTTPALQALITEITNLLKKNIVYRFKSSLNGHISYGIDEHNIIVTINPSSKLTISNLYFALLAGKYDIQNYYIAPLDFFNDNRNKIIKELSSDLLIIPLLSEMSRHSISINDFFLSTLNEIKDTLSSRTEHDIENLHLFRVHLEAIIFIRINYETPFLSRGEKSDIEELYEKKSPISFLLAKEILRILRNLNPYSLNGNLLCNYHCIVLLNKNEYNDSIKGYTENLYLDYINYLENKLAKESINIVPMQ